MKGAVLFLAKEVELCETQPPLLKRRHGMTLASALRPAWAGRDGEVAIYLDGHSLTFSEVSAAAASIAATLAPHTPSTVALWLQATPAWPLALLGVLAAGASPLDLDPAWPRDRVAAAVAAAGATLILWDSDDADTPPPPSLGSGVHSMQLPRLTEGRVPPPLPPAPLPAHVWLVSSGSTRTGPSVASIPWAGIAARAAWAASTLGLGPGARVGVRCPPFTADAVNEVLSPLLTGAALVMLPRAAVETGGGALATALADARLTHLSLTPALWGAVARAPGACAALTSLTCACSTGSLLPVGLARTLVEDVLPSHASFFNVYGSAECGADAAAADVGAWLASGYHTAIVAAGTPAVAATALFVVEAGVVEGGESQPITRLTPLPAGVVGIVCVVGPGVATHTAPASSAIVHATIDSGTGAMLKAPGACPPTSPTRVLVTGDEGHITPGVSPSLIVTGRATRTVRLGATWASLDEVEAVLSGAPGVEAVAAVCVGQAVVAVVAGATVTPAVVIAAASRRLPPRAVPTRVLVVDALPRLASGKIDYRAVEARVVSCAAAQSPRPLRPTEAAVAAAMAAALASAGIVTRLEATSDLFEVGGDSLVAAEAAAALGVKTAVVITGRTPRGVAAQSTHRPLKRGRGDRDATPPPPASAQWRVALAGCVDAPPALAGDGTTPFIVAAAHTGDAVAVAAATGAVMWRLPADSQAPCEGACGVGGDAVAVARGGDSPALVWCPPPTTVVPLPSAPRGPASPCPWTPGAVWCGLRDGSVVTATAAGILWRFAVSDRAALAGAPVAAPCGSVAVLATLEAGGDASLIALGRPATTTVPPTISWRSLSPWRGPLAGGVVVTESAAIAACAGGMAAAVDLNHGGLVWKVDLDGPVFGRPLAHTASATIILAERGGSVVRLDAATGRVEWRSTARCGGLPTGPSLSTDGAAILLATDTGAVLALDTATGTDRGAVTASAAPTFGGPPLVVPGGGVVVGTRDDSVACLRPFW